MGKTILYTLKGAAIGAIGAVCLFVVGFCIELFNMGCAILTCDCDKPMVFDWSGMWGLLFICTIGGAVVGMVYDRILRSNMQPKDNRLLPPL